METVVLVVHLLLALTLIGVVLMQRSEGGGLGIGGGGGAATGRSAGTALGKVTWGLAIAFICTSLALTIFAAQDSTGGSVLDRIGAQPAPDADGDAPALPGSDGQGLLPPTPSGESDALLPQAD
ncbi:preprotein translocase subunit SecG [Histidinibacterium aquaticum]|uniref:Protein-export membrane protein SecG n=1 Tax=Histidinibacterium aquaticum TaxID=2613962 RepID=A0A5J5GI65_9RHOB|nr:preprotein translocase subunit SecG [Histidinibacterium aquaticum]KAA9007939.1 preprotein translocase subunit SecG [Histidinibacterium aquaticum]